jgi:hypothetical protein
MKKSPLLALLPMVANTVFSLIKDKKEAKVPTTLEEGVSISSKRVLNLVGTAAIITFALNDMANGINAMNLAVLALGVAYSAAMSFITNKSEA